MSALPNSIDNKRTYIQRQIDTLQISSDWKKSLKDFCNYRTYIRPLKEKQKQQLENIALANSNEVKLFLEGGKSTGIDWIEFIAIELHNEEIRRKAVNILLRKGVGKGKDEVLALSLSPDNESQRSN